MLCVRACAGEPQYRGKWVADVSVAHPNGALIRKYQKIKTLRTQLRLAIVRAQKLRSEGKVQKIEKGVQEVEKLAKELEEVRSRTATRESTPRELPHSSPLRALSSRSIPRHWRTSLTSALRRS